MHRFGVFILIISLTGCDGQELYTQLSEQQANEMVAVMLNAGLPAEKRALDEKTFSVTTSEAYFAQAVELLNAHGYPRDQYESLGEVFKKEGFVSSPLEERARLIHALSQEIANTIASIDGVIVARVHLAVPEKNPLSEDITPSSASVFIKHRRGIDLSGSTSQIKALVVNGVEGLPYDNVTVALFAAETWPAPRRMPVQEFSPGFVKDISITMFGAIGALGLVGGGVWMLRRRRRNTLPDVMRGNQS